MILLIAAVISFLAGLALAYWLLEKRLQQQKQNQSEQTRRISEEMERNHQSRMQETIKSLQAGEENRLRQVTEELEQAHNSRLQETIQSLQEQHDAHLIQITDELQKTYEDRRQSELQSLQHQHQSELKQTTEELQVREAQMQVTISELQAQYETQLMQASEELARTYEAQKQSAIDLLQEEYENNLRLAAAESQAHEAQMQGNIRLLQEHYETQLKNATEELQTHEGYTQQTVRMLQKHYESQLGENPVLEASPSETVIPSFLESSQSDTLTSTHSAPLELEIEEQKIPTLNFTAKPLAQELDNKIVAWGDSRQISFVNQLISYSNHQNVLIRRLVASALGKIATVNSFRVELQPAIPILGKLSKDLEPQVRLSAVEALGAIKSDKVIPFLQSSLRDTDGAVVKSASLALEKFRYYPAKSAAKTKDSKLKKPQR